MLKTLLAMFKKEHALNVRVVWTGTGVHSSRMKVRFNDDKILSVESADSTTTITHLDGVHYSISASCVASGYGTVVVPIEWITIAEMYLGNLTNHRCYSVSKAPINSVLFVLD